jgi:hypothetical protein
MRSLLHNHPQGCSAQWPSLCKDEADDGYRWDRGRPQSASEIGAFECVEGWDDSSKMEDGVDRGRKIAGIATSSDEGGERRLCSMLLSMYTAFRGAVCLCCISIGFASAWGTAKGSLRLYSFISAPTPAASQGRADWTREGISECAGDNKKIDTMVVIHRYLVQSGYFSSDSFRRQG